MSQPETVGAEGRAEAPRFDEGLEHLEALVQKLEGGSLTLEEALATFESGVKLSQNLQQQLGEAQRRVEVLKAGLGGEYRAETLGGGEL